MYNAELPVARAFDDRADEIGHGGLSSTSRAPGECRAAPSTIAFSPSTDIFATREVSSSLLQTCRLVMMGHRASIRRGLPRLICFAHRGAASELPENTLPSFERALSLGADALEMDLHLTSDGVVVVAHDPDGRRMAGRSDEIRRSTLREVKSWDVGFGFIEQGFRPHHDKGFRIPTFEEVLDAFPGILLNVDAKQLSPPVVPALLDLVDRRGAADRVNIASFHRSALRDTRKRGFAGTTSLAPLEIALALTLPVAVISRLRGLGRMGDSAQIPLREGPIVLARRGFVDKCRAAGLTVDFWTVNDPSVAREVARLGADGIMTDDPRAIVPVVRAARQALEGR